MWKCTDLQVSIIYLSNFKLVSMIKPIFLADVENEEEKCKKIYFYPH